MGAGNCNDLDLKRLGQAFSTIHLVDIDKQALNQGVRNQKIDDGNVIIHKHGGVDVTGIEQYLRRWYAGKAMPEKEDMLRCIKDALNTRIRLPGAMDVVASTGILSQLMEALNRSSGYRHPKFIQLAASVRTRHIELLLASLKPGGRALIITDTVSANKIPGLLEAGPDKLPALFKQIVKDNKCLTGVNPEHLRRVCYESPGIACQISSVRISHPWIWHMPGSPFVVCAVEIIKKP